MTKFIEVKPLENYILKIKTNDGHIFDFDVLAELKRIPSYKRLYDIDFFRQVHFRNQRIYWDYDHDFHIDQVLANAKQLQ
jgi:hypothetical protein